MDKSILPLLCNPFVGEPFALENNTLVSVSKKTRYEIIDGIPVILDKPALSGKSLWNRWLYDRIAFGYDVVLDIGSKTKIAQDNVARDYYLSKIDLPIEGRLFESAIGTGNNFKYYPNSLEMFGSDISLNMLKVAKEKSKSYAVTPHLFQAEGSFLPFSSNLFDITIQFGALQFHTDVFKCISEMVRIAKPGSWIHIVDEIRGIRKILKKMPAHKKYSSPSDLAVRSLDRLVPHSMQNIESDIIQGTNFCFLKFQKPML